MFLFSTVRAILFVACIFVPFTELRFGAFGVGEVSLGLAFALYLYAAKGRIRIDKGYRLFVNFWFMFIGVLVVGFAFNFFILGYASGTLEQAAFDLVAYLVVLMFFLLASDCRVFGQGGPEQFCFRVYCTWFGIFLILYFLSLRTPSLFGMQLRYYDKFTPLVSNLHQASMLLCALPFLGLHLLAVRRNFLERAWVTASIPMFTIMAIESTSTKARMALTFGVTVFFLWLVAFRTKGRHRFTNNIASFGALFPVILVATFIYWDKLLSTAVEFFREEDPLQAREIIYSDAYQHGLSSLIFGYGPGPQVLYSGSYWDAHMTLLTIFLQSGVLGLALFLAFAVRLVRVASVSAALMACFTAIGIYALGGDILRRLPIWIVLFAVLTYARARQSRVASTPAADKEPGAPVARSSRRADSAFTAIGQR